MTRALRLAFVLLLLAAPRLDAQRAAGEDRRRELADLRRRVAELKARWEQTKKRAADVKAELAAAELNLQLRTEERKLLEAQKAAAAADAKSALESRDEASRQVLVLRSDLAERLAGLYRLGRVGYLRMLAQADSGRGLLRSVQLLSHLARRDAALLRRYETALATLAARQQDVEVRQKQLARLAADARRHEAAMAAARAEKAALLGRLERTGAQEQQAVTTLEEKSRRLESLLSLLEEHGRTLPPGAASISRFAGALDWPLAGKVVVPFGRIANPRFPSTFLRSSGWTIDAPPGTPVKAVFSGEVVHAQWLKGYGNLVVLDHGEGVFTLYGRLVTGTVQKGARVSLGEPVGILGETPEEEVPGLYFEIRSQRASVDPRNWLR